MTRFSTILLLVCLGVTSAFAQGRQGKIKGQLTDKTSGEALPAATVVLLHAKDSSVATTVLTDNKGNFDIKGINDGQYRLYITFLGYQPVAKPISISAEHPEEDVGTLALPRKGVNLNTVEIIEEKPPIVVKKDTLEFNAGSFKTRENAVVEDLLKKLPGVQVDKDGTITAQGETVKTVYVDGKPFFGTDPKMATKNLPADIIDKVQLIDKKSDQAEFTKIDDGNREKAINIVVKKDKKKGYFGRVTAGAGTNDRFTASASLNRFRDNQQLSFIGGGNNLNNLGFTYQDISNFSGSRDAGGGGRGRGMGGMMRSRNMNAMPSDGSSNGITRSWNAGVNFNQEMNKKLKLNASYFFNNAQTEQEQRTARQNLLPDTTFYYNTNNQSLSENNNNRVNMRVEYELDSLHSFIISPSFGYSNSTRYSSSDYQSLGTKKDTVNAGSTENSATTQSPMFNSMMLFRKRFKKAGRTFSVMTSFANNKQESEGFNKSSTRFFNADGTVRTESFDQRNDINTLSRNFSSRLTYTEPIFKNRFLELSYSFASNFNNTDKKTYDFDKSTNAYSKLNDSLSNAFENTGYTHQTGFSIRTQQEKFSYTLGLGVVFNTQNSHNLTRDSAFSQRTVNFAPNAMLEYEIRKGKRLSFSYEGMTQQPSLQQLQPVPDNSNPLYVQLGNPDLKPAFNNSVRLMYSSFDIASMRGLFAGINGQFTTNKIVNAVTFDKDGKQTSRPVNVNGSYNVNAHMNNSFPLKQQTTALNSTTMVMYNRDISFTNGVKNRIGNLNVSQRVTINYMYKELFDFSAGGMFNYNGARYSVQKDNNTNYFDYSLTFDGNLNLPWNMSIGSDVAYTLNTGRTAGYNLDVLMLNAFISKAVFNKKQGLLKVQGFDLLNQNVSISRNVGENYIEDIQSKVLTRYFMVSFTYFLNRFGNNGKAEGGQRMRVPGGRGFRAQPVMF